MFRLLLILRKIKIIQNFDVLFELVNGGAAAQITSDSLNGKHGKNSKVMYSNDSK